MMGTGDSLGRLTEVGTRLLDGPGVSIVVTASNMNLQEATSRTEVSLEVDAAQEKQDARPGVPRAFLKNERAGTAASP
jgi:hypothetical protein